ncbi:HAD-IIB family hydrolase [Thalassobius vesicularis]|uniref:HAD-IIB family hydrolase n=1 Tax=Thalassobius vesicularis TaxID=1294297 RepID=A0A4V3UZ53_9RHOB|nr:HAD-IIB family hydrolase [Thalassobius vesicularis]
MTYAPAAIVFTDLDGTLLDHHSYDYSAAIPALNLLKSLDIPVVLASSKTAAELAPLRAELGLVACPAIVENGAGVLQPHESADTIQSEDYAYIRATLDQSPVELRQYFNGFGDISDVEVAQITGLPLANARLARQRCFSEPGLWTGTNQQRETFLAHLADHDISARQGGRFLTLSRGKTKADHLASICNRYGNPKVIALGDAPNDLEMLLAADIPVLIRNPDAAPLSGLTAPQNARLMRSTLTGPAGWNEMIQKIVPTLTHSQEGD